MATLVQSVGRLVRWTLVIALFAGGTAAAYVFYHINDEIRQHALRLLEGHYPELDIRIRSARWVRGEGVELRGVSLGDPRLAGEAAELVYVDEVFLAGPKELQDLVSDALHIEQLVLRRPTIFATQLAEGGWNVSRLLPLPQFSAKPPPAAIEDGRIIVVDPHRQPASNFEARQLYTTVHPQSDAGGNDELAVEGRLIGDHTRAVVFNGSLAPDMSHWSLGGSVTALEVSPKLLESLPGELPGWTLELGGVAGQAFLEFQLARAAPDAQLSFTVDANVQHGRVDHPRLPFPLSDVRADIHANADGLHVRGLVARNGPTTLWMASHQQGLQPDSPIELQARVRKMALDDRLRESLPAAWRASWNKFLPSGEIDVDLTANYDGQTWKPKLAAVCRDSAFTFYKFPYRLNHTTGTLNFENDKLVANLTAYSDISPIRIDCELTHPGENAIGTIVARGEDLQINDKLLAALPEETRRVVREMRPRGGFDVHFEQTRATAQETPKRSIWIGLQGCSVRCEKFPYPIDNIRGTIEMANDRWEFRGLQGTNDRGFVSCQGHMSKVGPGSELVLNFEGKLIPLEVELRDALQPSAQRLWDDLKPHGTVDLTCRLNYRSADRRLDLAAEVRPLPGTTSIEPVFFPYRLDNLSGTFKYRNGVVDFQQLRGVHDQVRVSSDGHCEVSAEGRWQLDLNNLTVDRMQVDHDLHRALPPALRRMVDRAKLKGRLNLRSSELRLAGSGAADAPITASWRLYCDAHRASLQCGPLLENIHGTVVLEGAFDGSTARSWGNLQLDTLSYGDYQLTQLSGPLWIDDRTLCLGAFAQQTVEGQPPPHIVARAIGGYVRGDAWVTLTESPRYYVNASLVGGDLRRCAQEIFAGPQDLHGTVMAQVRLTGAGAETHTIRGSGEVHLSDANIYELPLMVAMLKILSVRSPDPTAFSNSDIAFRIEGDHIYCDRIDFRGDAISLLGKGQMDFDRHLDLTFHAMVGRDEFRVPIVRDVIGEASKQVLLIHVGGTLDNPLTRKEAFPGVNQALQTLQGDVPRVIGRRE